MRPQLNKNISTKDFQDFYWLKAELQEFCRKHGLSSSGGKQEIADRIATYLQTGKQEKPISKKFKQKQSEEKYSLQTKVTKDFTCTREIRNFFESILGPKFTFSVTLQKYIKSNPGITFADIANEYKKQEALKKAGKFKSDIGSQFEYNRFVRDYFSDPQNKGKPLKACINAWNDIKKKPGSNRYKPS